MKHKRLRGKIKGVWVNPGGNWNVPRDWFPTLAIDQQKGTVMVSTSDTQGRQKKASVTTECRIDSATDGPALMVRGSVEVHNWINVKCSGEQSFCFVVFEGDSGHIYVHRAPASKGWMEMICSYPAIVRRLRKLGIGADSGVVQQGDFLLKPANGKAISDAEFKHETTGWGHHNFDRPVLTAWTREAGRQVKIIDAHTRIIHKAVDGIQHPDVIIPPGTYIVGTTAESLRHSNRRD